MKLILYMPHQKSFDSFFTAGWTSLYFVFDEETTITVGSGLDVLSDAPLRRYPKESTLFNQTLAAQQLMRVGHGHPSEHSRYLRTPPGGFAW